ncbi:MAG: NAD(P)H-dependent oxidoreductase subunit E, partial [Gallionella sp.]|nr:NAD(P)H-dependent oxidoreductase subunit E [Gallionella sp.]
MASPTDTHAEYLDPILSRHQHNANDLLQILIAAQDHYGYIHSDAIDHLSEQLKLPRSKIEGVSGFYSFLH